MSVETLKSVFDVATVILLFATFVTGAGVLLTGNIINERQANHLRDFDKSLTEAKFELGKQQERAANAEQSAAEAKRTAESLQNEVATANEKIAQAQMTAEGFRLDIARVNEKTAGAMKEAEQERLARVRIEEKLAGWKLDASAQNLIIDQLKPYANTAFDLGTNPDELAFMETIDGMLTSAGWNRQIPKPDNPLFNVLLSGKARINYQSGIHIEIAQSSTEKLYPAALALVESLRTHGIPADGQISSNEPDPSCIHILIGKK